MDIDISLVWQVVEIKLLDKQVHVGYVYTIDPEFGHVVLLVRCLLELFLILNLNVLFVEKREWLRSTNRLYASWNIINHVK